MITDWVESVNKCNEAISEVNKVLEEQRIEMIDRIARICNKHGLNVDTDSIVGSSDNSIFTVRFDGNTSNCIEFPRKFLYDLNMSFAVKREMDKRGNIVMYMVIYPLEE